MQYMEKFQESREKARRNIMLADHMLTQTYPLIKDPKLLLAVIENIFLALTNSMATVLYYERLFKRIPPFHDNFESKFNLFKMKTAIRYNISQEYLYLMQEVKDIIIEHRKSPVEFTRENKFVICSSTYNMKTISVDQMKKYIQKTKSFLEIAESIVSKNESIFVK